MNAHQQRQVDTPTKPGKMTSNTAPPAQEQKQQQQPCQVKRS
ncbi:hypothetical protein T01_4987 [Trichinella spiralis]|uniref:Uncharacterized protein n=1 Tax=Trichinella spiralis TaxID=6334 RepID=A0A0V1AHJ8_TRISP|nr:hypothetical protein T01_4987 [Trichinella spiralis]